MEKDLGKFIKEARAEKDITLRQLATRTGISASYLNLLEKGTDPRSGNPPSVTLATLQKLASGLDAPLATLIKAAQDGNIGAVLPIEVTEPLTDAPRLVKGEDILMVPLICKLAKGRNCLADMDRVGQFPVNAIACNIKKEEIVKCYAMAMGDDSMAPAICRGDVVIIKPGPVVDGQIGAIICDGEEGVIRKISYVEPDHAALLCKNSRYKPVIKPVKDCHVLGQVISRMGPPQCD